MLQGFKPGMTLTLLRAFALGKHKFKGTELDQYYTKLALKDGKQLGQLVSLDEQISFLENLSIGHEDEFVRYAIDDIGRLPESFIELKQAWRSGDTNALEQNLIAPVIEDFPTVYNSMIVERNKSWQPKIEAMLKTADIEFVIIKIDHLAGPDSLIEGLKKNGYSIKQL